VLEGLRKQLGVEPLNPQ